MTNKKAETETETETETDLPYVSVTRNVLHCVKQLCICVHIESNGFVFSNIRRPFSHNSKKEEPPCQSDQCFEILVLRS